MRYDGLLELATAKTSSALKWRNKVDKWSAIVERLSTTTRTSESLRDYFGFTKQRQDEIKDVGGFVGGKLRGGVITVRATGKELEISEPYGLRRNAHVVSRQIVALDVDHGDLDVWLDFRGLGCAGMMYTTHKHQTAAARFRIVFPLDRPVNPDEYEAIGRQIASYLDIEKFDDTTYQPVRMMYWPSTAFDGEFIADVFDAPFMCADEILGEMEDSGDPKTWPRSQRDKAVRASAGGEGALTDPRIKDGIVGAFCRCYGIEEAISEFLDEVYTPSEDHANRYTFLAGSSSNGLEVFDDLFAYSYHESDPAGSKACNAFDLVRLHKFGELDATFTGEDIIKAPSFKAMTTFASKLPAVKRELVQSKSRSVDYDAIEDIAFTAATMDEWMERLELDKQGNVKSTIGNALLVFTNDPAFTGVFAFNEFEQREVALKPCPWDRKSRRLKYPRPLEEFDDAEISLYMEQTYNITHEGNIGKALKVVSSRNSFHPVREYLARLEWDGVERLGTLLHVLYGVDNNEYNRTIMTQWAKAGVARILDSGCKFDYMLLLAGEQRRGKSTLFDRLGMGWYTDSVAKVEGKEAFEGLQGAWVVEMAELASLRKAEAEHAKHFLSKREDRFRVAFGKRVGYFPRSCVFGGTTNKRTFFKDETGNMRYWVADMFGKRGVLRGDEYLTDEIVAQIWAEAQELYFLDKNLELPQHITDEAVVIQSQYVDTDTRTGMIEEYLDVKLAKDWAIKKWSDRRMHFEMGYDGEVDRHAVCLMDLWVEVMGRNPADMQRKDSMELGALMSGIQGWEQTTQFRTPFYGMVKMWTRKVGFAHTQAPYFWDGKSVTKQK